MSIILLGNEFHSLIGHPWNEWPTTALYVLMGSIIQKVSISTIIFNNI